MNTIILQRVDHGRRKRRGSFRYETSHLELPKSSTHMTLRRSFSVFRLLHRLKTIAAIRVQRTSVRHVCVQFVSTHKIEALQSPGNIILVKLTAIAVWQGSQLRLQLVSLLVRKSRHACALNSGCKQWDLQWSN